MIFSISGSEFIINTPTDHSYEHVMIKPNSQHFVFDLRMCSDAHIALLSSAEGVSQPYYEVIIGSDYNRQCVIKKWPDGDRMNRIRIDGLLDCEQFRYEQS